MTTEQANQMLHALQNAVWHDDVVTPIEVTVLNKNAGGESFVLGDLKREDSLYYAIWSNVTISGDFLVIENVARQHEVWILLSEIASFEFQVIPESEI